MGEAALASSVYGILTVVLLRPLFDDPSSTIIGPGSVASWLHAPNTDFFMWALSWTWHSLTSDPTAILGANILPPNPHSLAAVFPKIGHVPIFGPLLAFSGNAVLANQLNLLANLSLSGGAAYWLMRHWRVDRAGAFFAGLVYALAPTRVSTIASPALAAGQYLPLALILLERCAAKANLRSALAAAGMFLWQASCALPYAMIVTIAAPIYATLQARKETSPAARRALLFVVLTTLCGVAALLTPALIGLASGQLIPPGRLEIGGIAFGAVPSLWDFTDRSVAYSVTGTRGLTLPPFAGNATLLLALAGFIFGQRNSGDTSPRPALGALLVIAFTLSATEVGAIAADLLPWGNFVLVPSHFLLLFLFVLALAAGLGLGALSSRLPAAAAAALLLALAAVFCWETALLDGPREIKTVKRRARPSLLQTRLSSRPEGAYVEVPFQRCRFDARIHQAASMFASTHSWQPLLNGYAELSASNQELIDSLVNALPHPEAVRLLAGIVDLRHIVLNATALAVDERSAWTSNSSLRDLGFADGRVLLEVIEAGDPALRNAFANIDERQQTIQGNPVGPLPRGSRAAALDLSHRTPHAAPNLPTVVRATVHNAGAHTWPVLGGSTGHQVRITYRWEDSSGNPIAGGEEHSVRLPFDVAPQDTVSFEFCVRPPRTTGEVYLVAGITQGSEWFAGEPARAPIQIKPLVPYKP